MSMSNQEFFNCSATSSKVEVKSGESILTIPMVTKLIRDNLSDPDDIKNRAMGYKVSETEIWHSLWHNVRELAEMLYMFPEKNGPSVFIFHKNDFLNTGFVIGMLIAEYYKKFNYDASNVIAQTSINKADSEGLFLSKNSYNGDRYNLKREPIKSKLSKATTWIPFCHNLPLTEHELDDLTQKYKVAGAKIYLYVPMFDKFDAIDASLWEDEKESERAKILADQGESIFQKWRSRVKEIIDKKGLIIVNRTDLLRDGKLLKAENDIIELFTNKFCAKKIIDSLFLDLDQRFKKITRLEKKLKGIVPAFVPSSPSSTAVLVSVLSQQPEQKEKQDEKLLKPEKSEDRIIKGGFSFLNEDRVEMLSANDKERTFTNMAQFFMVYRLVCEQQEEGVRERLSQRFK